MTSSFFTNNDFMPHGMCYLWQADILWTSVISDVLTALAYFSITAAVVIFVNKRKDLPYPWFFILAGSVIFLACGTSHLVSAIVIWEPIYGISAIVKAITALASVATGIVIWFVLPFFLSLPSPAMLEKKNLALQDSLDKLNLAQLSLIESEKMASLGGLVAGVAHEINTPLGISITAVSHLMETTDKLAEHFILNQISRTEFSRYIEKAKISTNLINVNLQRSADLVNNFKLVAVDQSSKNLRLYKVKQYIDNILTSLQSILKKKQCTLSLSCADDITLWGDPGVLTQIITNLVMNSIIHGFENTNERNINIVITKTEQFLLLNYNDSGSGIKEEDQDKIFEPFFTTRRAKGSSGLGLHIVFNLVTQSLKGTIDCVSDLENGAQFILKFPFDTRNTSG
ncbi:sensor histidine kinase [Colwellia piezophila]|uniref:sensor histidine kinase n=1 Tax=Colwellia piezophila TaxID=211668 RepID=UPI00035C48C9|nr:HAMP domain-containing sensor histidine kinase [Colwellia piezophila]